MSVTSLVASSANVARSGTLYVPCTPVITSACIYRQFAARLRVASESEPPESASAPSAPTDCHTARTGSRHGSQAAGGWATNESRTALQTCKRVAPDNGASLVTGCLSFRRTLTRTRRIVHEWRKVVRAERHYPDQVPRPSAPERAR